MNITMVVLSWYAPFIMVQGLGDILRGKYRLGFSLTLCGVGLVIIYYLSLKEIAGGIFGDRPSFFAVLGAFLSGISYLVIWGINNCRYSSYWIKEAKAEKVRIGIIKYAVYLAGFSPHIMLLIIFTIL